MSQLHFEWFQSRGFGTYFGQYVKEEIMLKIDEARHS